MRNHRYGVVALQHKLAKVLPHQTSRPVLPLRSKLALLQCFSQTEVHHLILLMVDLIAKLTSMIHLLQILHLGAPQTVHAHAAGARRLEDAQISRHARVRRQASPYP